MVGTIFPTPDAGGVEVRNAAGVCIDPPPAEKAYCPPAGYVTTCPVTALPSDCTARLEPKQINAIVSELLALGQCWDPNGPWDCDSLNNLCSAFLTWAASLDIDAGPSIYIDITPPPTAQPNSLWWENDTGFLFILYNDGNSTQWVQVNATGGTGGVMDGVSIVGAGTIGEPHSVGLVDCGSY